MLASIGNKRDERTLCIHTSLSRTLTPLINPLSQRQLRHQFLSYRQADKCKRKPKASSFSRYRRLSIHVAAPITISKNVQKCDNFLNLRAFETGAGANEPPKRWQKVRSIRGSNPGPFPSVQHAAALILLSPEGF